MRFCPVCGRDHDPGPCPMPSVAPTSPDWESRQYLRISRTISIAGLLLIVAGQFVPRASPGMEIVGVLALVLGFATYRLSRQKRLERESKREA